MKRAFDFLGAAAALLVLAPAMLVLALLVRHKLGAPVLFSQRRLQERRHIRRMGPAAAAAVRPL